MTASLALPLTEVSSEQPVGTGALYGQMWKHAEGARGWMLLSSSMLVTSQVVKLLVPWCTAQAIEALQRGGPDSARTSLTWIAAIVGIYVVSWLLHGPGRVIERTVAVRVRRSLTDTLYARLSDAPLGWHGSQHPAELAHRLAQSTRALTDFTQNQFIYLQNAVNLIGPLLALWWLSHLTGLVALGGLVLVALTIIGFDRAMMRLAQVENRAERSLSAATLDCLANITTVLSLRLQQATRRLLARRLQAVIAPLRRSIVLTEWKWCAVDLLSVLLSWGLVALYAWQQRSAGTFMLGGVFMVFQYAQQAGGVIGSLATNLQNFARIRTDFASAAPLWEAPQSREPASSHLAVAPWQHVDVCALSYRHPLVPGRRSLDGVQGEAAGLDRVSLRLHAGERIALVGPSGSGKSTLLRLLAGLNMPSGGHVEFDGVAALGTQALQGAATLIPQDAQVFEASVRENIAFDLPYTDAEVLQVARLAEFDRVIDELPDGLDSMVAQGGSNLSGGQRQRLCLARGLLAARGSSMLLLDEPTSALDPLGEAMVYQQIDEAFPQACIVASVHRMSLLARFDRVVLMVRGRVVDIGTVAELRERQALFREMVGTESHRDEAVEARLKADINARLDQERQALIA